MSFTNNINNNVITNNIYKTSPAQKLELKNAAHRIKFGSPKLRDLLREKCRIRLKECRGKAFDNMRLLSQEAKEEVNSILRSELAEIEHDIDMQDLIFKELLEENYVWLYQELEDESNAAVELNDTLTVFCPICEKCILNSANNVIYCSCGFNLECNAGLNEFYNLLSCELMTHSNENELTACPEKLFFIAEPILNSKCMTLNAVCLKCEYFSKILP